MVSHKHSRFRREKAKMKALLTPLPCYGRLNNGQLTVEDCETIDRAIGAELMGIATIREAWFAINVQTCKVLVNEWRHGGAQWLGELLNKTNPDVFKAYSVAKTLTK